MAARGMALRSTGAEPRPRVPLTLTTAELWRRLPLTSTRVWSGDRPRNWAGRTASLASAPLGRAKFIDGSRRASTVASSPDPVLSNSLLPMTSTGDSESSVRRLSERVPVTTTVCDSAVVVAGIGAVWAWAASGARVAIRLKMVRARAGLALVCLQLMAYLYMFIRNAAAPGLQAGRKPNSWAIALPIMNRIKLITMVKRGGGALT